MNLLLSVYPTDTRSNYGMHYPRDDVQSLKRPWPETFCHFLDRNYVAAAYCYRRSIGLSVCLSRSWALQKRVNRSRCCLACGLGWAQESMC